MLLDHHTIAVTYSLIFLSTEERFLETLILAEITYLLN
jgi:hypothetical protein